MKANLAPFLFSFFLNHGVSKVKPACPPETLAIFHPLIIPSLCLCASVVKNG